MGDIREYRPADESACLDLFDSNRPKYFAASERDLFAAYLRRRNRPYFVVEVLGQVRGCGGFHVEDHGVSHLDWGMVHADWHRRGVGADLLEWRLDRIRQIAHAWCVLIDTSQQHSSVLRSVRLRTVSDDGRRISAGPRQSVHAARLGHTAHRTHRSA